MTDEQGKRNFTPTEGPLDNEPDFPLFHHPDIQQNALELLVPLGLADIEGVVQPRIGTIGRGLELRGRLEVEGRLYRHVLRVPALRVTRLRSGNDTTVAHVDVSAVVSLDAVNGFQLGAAAIGIGQLVVGPAIQDGALQ